MIIKIASYSDLKTVRTKGVSEKFVQANRYDNSIECRYYLSDMKIYFNGVIIVRDFVAKKLAKANKELKKIDRRFILLVAYGYRSLEIQKKYFDAELERIKKYNNSLTTDKAFELAHKKIAVPEVAGHPTGAAVDVTIYDLKAKKVVDMGGEIDDVSDKRIATFSPGLSEEQVKNRRILLDVMLNQSFCPFYGEWWHFSYGDKEWAFFYDKKNAIYEQVGIEMIRLKNKINLLNYTPLFF